jgi:hypothetical protein
MHIDNRGSPKLAIRPELAEKLLATVLEGVNKNGVDPVSWTVAEWEK